jgi:hypothetical protein
MTGRTFLIVVLDYVASRYVGLLISYGLFHDDISSPRMYSVELYGY